MKKDQRGFTLMELMIVIVIIGVLAAIGVPAYRNYVTEAKEAACKANVRTISTAFHMHYAEEGRYPVSDDQQTIRNALAKYVSNIDAIAKCPADESISYEFSCSGDGSSESLTSIRCPKHEMEYRVSGTPSGVWLPFEPVAGGE